MSEAREFWTGERVRLRAVEPADWERFWSYDRDAESQRSGHRIFPPVSAVSQRAWTQEQSEKRPGGDDDAYRMVIETLDGGEMVGGVLLHHCDRLNGNFEYGIHIAAGHRGHGYAVEAVRLALSFMFGECRYHRCCATVLDGNEGSLALQRRLGFTEEGVRREQAFHGGRYLDLHEFGLLAAEFEEHERAAGREPYFTVG